MHILLQVLLVVLGTFLLIFALGVAMMVACMIFAAFFYGVMGIIILVRKCFYREEVVESDDEEYILIQPDPEDVQEAYGQDV